MKSSMLTPCAEWAVLLAVNPAELAPAERQALADHMIGCQACRSAQRNYALQDAFLHQQPVPAPLAGLPPLLLAAWAAEEGQRQAPARTSGPIPLPARAARRSRRLPVLLSTVAAVLVVALLVSALVVSRLPAGTHPRPTARGTPTPGFPTPPTPDGTFTPVPGLAQLSNEPIIAPSNPKIIYLVPYTDGQTTQLSISRSDDGGVTWRSFPAPPVVTELFMVSLIISPLDPQVIFLYITNYDTSPNSCPGLSAAANLAPAYSGFPTCSLEFFSRDGGSHWQRLVLPLPAQGGADSSLTEGMGNLGSAAGPYLRAQGTRLYAFLDTATGTFGETHLIVSMDGGQTWRIDDAGIGAANRYLCDAMPAPDGAVIFALVFTNPCGGGGTEEFWRSDDAGATWHQAGPLPGNVQSFIVSSQGTRPKPLVYMTVSGQGSVPYNVKVSSDGGMTWRSLPEPGDLYTTLYISGLWGVLSDGTLLAGVVQPEAEYTYSDPYLYRWKPGETGWHEVAPEFIHGLRYLLVFGQPETIWIVQYIGYYTVQQLSKT